MGQILIIDRDITSTHPLTQALAQQGHTGVTLRQGEEPLAWAKEHHPDAIILSVELVGVSGYAICNRLKKDEALKDIPLLLASGEATQEIFDEHRRLKTRADAYLFKPYDVAAVLQALQQTLGQTQAPQTADAMQRTAAARPAPEQNTEAAHTLVAAQPQLDLAAAGEASRAAESPDAGQDPLMSTDALLLLEGSVDVNKHTQVIRLPLARQGEQAQDLIGAALADLDADAMAALNDIEGRVRTLEDVLRAQASQLADQRALMTQLTDALARMESHHKCTAQALIEALKSSAT